MSMNMERLDTKAALGLALALIAACLATAGAAVNNPIGAWDIVSEDAGGTKSNVVLTLNFEDGLLTGTIDIGYEASFALINIDFDGTVLRFQVDPAQIDGARVVAHLTVLGDRIEGKATGDEGDFKVTGSRSSAIAGAWDLYRSDSYGTSSESVLNVTSKDGILAATLKDGYYGKFSLSDLTFERGVFRFTIDASGVGGDVMTGALEVDGDIMEGAASGPESRVSFKGAKAGSVLGIWDLIGSDGYETSKVKLIIGADHGKLSGTLVDQNYGEFPLTGVQYANDTLTFKLDGTPAGGGLFDGRLVLKEGKMEGTLADQNNKFTLRSP